MMALVGAVGSSPILPTAQALLCAGGSPGPPGRAAGGSRQLLSACCQAGICLCIKHFSSVHSFAF